MLFEVTLADLPAPKAAPLDLATRVERELDSQVVTLFAENPSLVTIPEERKAKMRAEIRKKLEAQDKAPRGQRNVCSRL